MNLDESKINVKTTNHIGVKVLKIRTEKKNSTVRNNIDISRNKDPSENYERKYLI